MLSIEITGLSETVAAFDGAPRIIEEEVEDAADSVLGRMVTVLATYPPERAGQRYQRTGTLGRGWTQTDRTFRLKLGGETTLRLTNPVAYAEDVQGDARGPLFVDRWRKASAVEAEYAPLAEEALEQALVRAERRVQSQME